MKYRTRTFYTDTQKSEMWDRWERGESLSSIGRGFNRASSSIYPLLARTGGIRPPKRVRSRLALTRPSWSSPSLRFSFTRPDIHAWCRNSNPRQSPIASYQFIDYMRQKNKRRMKNHTLSKSMAIFA
jgi:hypothetical protein